MTIQPARLLTIRDAVKLYFILEKYIDEAKEEKEQAKFIKKLANIISPTDYILCLSVLSGTPKEDIDDSDYLNAVSVFVGGLAMNQILSLYGWIKGL